MNSKDLILQEICPTIMVPKYSDLPGLGIGNRRYLMAEDGLWIETRQSWGHFRLPLWNSPVPMPYGEIDSLFEMERIPDALIYECVVMAQDKACGKKEWAGWIIWSREGGYEYLPLNIIHESTASVEFKHPVLPDGSYLVMDLHSHPFDLDKFSHVDDTDNIGGVYLAGVISFNADFEPKLTKRLCIEGHFFDERFGGVYG